MRPDDAAILFGIPFDKMIFFAEAAGAIYQLPRIMRIKCTVGS